MSNLTCFNYAELPKVCGRYVEDYITGINTTKTLVIIFAVFTFCNAIIYYKAYKNAIVREEYKKIVNTIKEKINETTKEESGGKNEKV